MAVVGFKDYKTGDQYKARRAMGKMSNFIWKTIATVVIVVVAVWLFKACAPWRHQITSTLDKGIITTGNGFH